MWDWYLCLLFCNVFTCCDPLECLCLWLAQWCTSKFYWAVWHGFFYFIVSPLLYTTFHYHHNHILLFFYHLYIYNKSFAFIVYVQINIYYLIMLSCVCPIRLGWSILARFITNCGSLFYFIFLILQNILCFFFLGKVGLKIIFWGWLSFDRHNMKFRCCHVTILRTAIIGLESLSKIF